MFTTSHVIVEMFVTLFEYTACCVRPGLPGVQLSCMPLGVTSLFLYANIFGMFDFRVSVEKHVLIVCLTIWFLRPKVFVLGVGVNIKNN